jgi:hypothetical protein
MISEVLVNIFPLFSLAILIGFSLLSSKRINLLHDPLTIGRMPAQYSPTSPSPNLPGTEGILQHPGEQLIFDHYCAP